MALKLEAALNTSAEMWMTMQAHHDLWHARQRKQPPTQATGRWLKA